MEIQGGVGVTSCMMVRLDNVIRYYNEYETNFPDTINSTNQFSMYKDFSGDDVSSWLFSKYEKPDFKIIEPLIHFNHGWQYGWLDEVHIEELCKINSAINPLSYRVMQISEEISGIIKDRTCVLYRGNDKSCEVARTPYESMISIAKESGATSFFVQTYENEFFQYFKDRFPDTICYDKIPRINKNPDSYVMVPVGQKKDFAVNFVAALHAISKSREIIMNSGNTGFMVGLFRGHHKGIWQYNGQHHTYRKLWN
jgi:hypothetical protein